MTLAAKKIYKSYGNSPVLQGASLEVDLGELHLLIGPSGCGKTTLLRVMSLLEPADQGEISLDGVTYTYRDLRKAASWSTNWPFRSRVAMVFQQLFMWPHLQVGEAIRLSTRGAFDLESHADRLGVGMLLSRFPNELSLGQRQRLALLRALATGADYLFFDEITSALDREASGRTLALVDELVRNGRGVVMVTHNPEALAHMAHKKHELNS